jgi:hypothetical protein
MFDVNAVPEGLVDALKSIKGIIRVRVLG